MNEVLTTTKDSLSEANDMIFVLKQDKADLEEKLLKIPILETVIESCQNEITTLKEQIVDLEHQIELLKGDKVDKMVGTDIEMVDVEIDAQNDLMAPMGSAMQMQQQMMGAGGMSGM